MVPSVGVEKAGAERDQADSAEFVGWVPRMRGLKAACVRDVNDFAPGKASANTTATSAIVHLER